MVKNGEFCYIYFITIKKKKRLVVDIIGYLAEMYGLPLSLLAETLFCLGV